MKKIAVVLFNLGGPDSLENVERFLFNLFFDKNIISLPLPLRWVIAKLISKLRVKKAKEIYRLMGNKSPILEYTRAQAEALAHNLKVCSEYEFKIFISMRYFYPTSKEIIAELEKLLPNEIILLPLYPQYSTTTTYSSILEFKESFEKAKLNLPLKTLCCYPVAKDFISAHVELIKPIYHQAQEKGKVRLLFSAHGLPQKIIEKGDPYQWQIEQTAALVVDNLAIQNLDWRVCYQSKVGPVKWTEPYTDQEIIEASRAGFVVIIVPIAFVSDHSETLVELDIEYKKLALENNSPGYFRVEALATNQLFINFLTNQCIELANYKNEKDIDIVSQNVYRLCPKQFSKCINNYNH
jgi:ferrochelatase